MAKIERVSTLSADPNKLKIVTDDGLVYHVTKTGREFSVGDEFEEDVEPFAPNVVPAPIEPAVEAEVLKDFSIAPDEQADPA